MNSYTITATADPEAGGTITGAGSYNHYETCTLTASNNTGYTFVNWTKDGVEVSTDLSISFTVDGTAAYVAHFSLNSYAITATADPTIGGTVGGAGTYNHFETCTLTATPATGYHFVNWTLNGQVVSTSNTYEFEVSGPASYVAHFEINSYTIAATANPTIGGTVSGAGTYNHFETCTLTATANTGYSFVNWTKDGAVVSTNPSISFTVEGAASYVAHFSLNSYQVTATADPVAGGEITGAGTYNHFETCTLVATPSTGYHFVNWTENGTVVSTSNTLVFEVTGPVSYVAHFALNNYTISVSANPTEGGVVTGGGNYDHFSTCTLTATPYETYLFVNWTLGGVEVSTNPTLTFTVTGDAYYVANFTLGYVDIHAFAVPSDWGTVEGAGEYLVGSTCTLTAIPVEGSRFVNWRKGGVVVSTDAVYSFEVTEEATYRACFELIPYSITAEANPEEAGTISGTGNMFYLNGTCQLVAHTNQGYHFVNWTLDGVEVSTSYIYSFTVTGSAHYVANFALNTFEITATIDPEDGGEVTGVGVYTYGQTVTMTAIANADYRFVNWTEGDEVVSEEETFVFTADRDRELVAHFISTVGVNAIDDMTVMVYPNPVIDRLFIEIDRPASRCEIYTVAGSLISSQEIVTTKFDIEVSDLVSGAYIIRIVTDSGVKNMRFVKL